MAGHITTQKTEIWRFEVPFRGGAEHELPCAAEVVQVLPSDRIIGLSFWMMIPVREGGKIDVRAGVAKRRFEIAGTGWSIPPGRIHWGTCRIDTEVWHLLEIRPV